MITQPTASERFFVFPRTQHKSPRIMRPMSETQTPQARIEADVKTAMKAKEKLRLGTLRMLLTEIKNKKIELGTEVDEATFTSLVRKGVKQRKDSAKQFDDGGRTEMAEKERAEIVVLEDYLPKQVGEDDVRAAIEAFVESEGLSGPKSMGPVMKAMKEKFGATADGAVLSRLAKEILTR